MYTAILNTYNPSEFQKKALIHMAVANRQETAPAIEELKSELDLLAKHETDSNLTVESTEDKRGIQVATKGFSDDIKVMTIYPFTTT